MNLLDPIRAEAVDGRVQITMPTTLLADLMCDVASRPDEMQALIEAVERASRDDAWLAESYSEDQPGDRTMSHSAARDRAESEVDEALAEVTRVIDLAQLRIRPAEARLLAMRLRDAAYLAERRTA